MDVVGALLLGWVLAGLGVVMLLNVAKSTVHRRSLRALRPQPSEPPHVRRELEPAVARPATVSGGRDPLIHFG